MLCADENLLVHFNMLLLAPLVNIFPILECRESLQICVNTLEYDEHVCGSDVARISIRMSTELWRNLKLVGILNSFLTFDSTREEMVLQYHIRKLIFVCG